MSIFTTGNAGPIQQVSSPGNAQLTMTQAILSSPPGHLYTTQPIFTSPPGQLYTTEIRAQPLHVSQVVARVAPPQVENIKDVSPATIIKEIEVDERYEIVPVKSQSNLLQKKAEPQMIMYEVPREPIGDTRERRVQERRAPKERAAAPPPEEVEEAHEEEPPPPPLQPEIIVRNHRIEVPVEVLRVVEKTVQIPVEKVSLGIFCETVLSNR